MACLQPCMWRPAQRRKARAYARRRCTRAPRAAAPRATATRPTATYAAATCAAATRAAQQHIRSYNRASAHPSRLSHTRARTSFLKVARPHTAKLLHLRTPAASHTPAPFWERRKTAGSLSPHEPSHIGSCDTGPSPQWWGVAVPRGVNRTEPCSCACSLHSLRLALLDWAGSARTPHLRYASALPQCIAVHIPRCNI